MDHEIVDGVLAGLLGPHLAQWFSRYRYRIVFVAGILATQLYFFITGCMKKGFKEATHIFFSDGFLWLAIIGPLAGGLVAVFIAFIGSAGNLSENKNSPSDREKDDS